MSFVEAGMLVFQLFYIMKYGAVHTALNNISQLYVIKLV